MSKGTLYILYNADASVMGKLKYGYRKLRSSSEGEPTCAACDITHGGLSLNESADWVAAKKEIEEGTNLSIVQWHRDEISPELKEFVVKSGLRYPAVVLDQKGGDLKVIMSNTDLAECRGDPKQLVTRLKDKGLMGQQTQASL